MAKEISIEIEAVNLGPHQILKRKDQISAIEIGIFANNGSGKTFLSRAFRLIGTNSPSIQHTNKLIALGQTDASFKVVLSNSKEPGIVRQASIELRKDKIPTISNTTDYVFHVFNRDYVLENLEELKFRPDGKIEGYILGKEKIDLTKEKAELQKQRAEHTKRVDKIEAAVSEAVKVLDTLGIRKNTTEYQVLKSQNIIDDPDRFSNIESFDSLQQKHSKLKSIPDVIADLNYPTLVVMPAFFDELIQFLEFSFNKSAIAEEFKKRVKSKQTFVEEGLRVMEEGREACPFCEQELKEDALALIDQYVKYLSDSESQQIRRANRYINEINDFYEGINHYQHEFLKLKEKFDEIKNYLPSFYGSNLTSVNDVVELKPTIDKLVSLLEGKKNDIGAGIDKSEAEPFISNISAWIQRCNRIHQNNVALAESLNVRKNNLQIERLELNKKLCKSKYSEVASTLKQTITEINELLVKISDLELEVQIKEQSEKVPKKDKVVQTFRGLLSMFFQTKYEFDEDEFCLRFLNYTLTENASDVLSDGEKSIVAFCYYLAETHRLIENESDYGKLFFVIDDPISSLDFHFVYSVAQSIRSLSKIFPLARLRYLILTHNLEFMSILIRNNIITGRYFMEPGKIQELRRNLIMPYEEHLRDIYNVATLVSDPTHTTPNSVRHVLETINRFIAPDVELSKFCEQVDGFQENAFLYALIQDSSHGGLRSQRAYTPEMITAGCKLVIEYIKKNYAGQVNLLNSVSAYSNSHET